MLKILTLCCFQLIVCLKRSTRYHSLFCYVLHGILTGGRRGGWGQTLDFYPEHRWAIVSRVELRVSVDLF